jgi:hypothetical protein
VTKALGVASNKGYDYQEVSALTGLHVESLLTAIDKKINILQIIQ